MNNIKSDSLNNYPIFLFKTKVNCQILPFKANGRNLSQPHKKPL
jgi:hypothetical protein